MSRGISYRLVHSLEPGPSRTSASAEFNPGFAPVRPVPLAPMPGPLVLDLVAAVLEGGAAPHSALQAVGAALAAVGDPQGDELLLRAVRISHPAAIDAAASPAGSESVQGARPRGPGIPASSLLPALEEALSLAARAGLPPTALIRRAAAEERRRQLSAQLRAIRRLEVLLVIPAGLCLLPAFVLLGIVPLVIRLITG